VLENVFTRRGEKGYLPLRGGLHDPPDEPGSSGRLWRAICRPGKILSGSIMQFLKKESNRMEKKRTTGIRGAQSGPAGMALKPDKIVTGGEKETRGV